MKIGIDCRPLSRPLTGISRVVSSIIRELQRIDGENLYYLYSDRDFEIPFHNERWHRRIGSHFPFLPGSLWLQTEAWKRIHDDQVDVFWGTVHMLPLALTSRVAKVMTIYDLVWKLYPETMTAFSRGMHRVFTGRSVRQADRLVAISRSTACDLEDLLHVTASKVAIAYPGVDERFRPLDQEASASYIASTYQVSPNYLLAVGTIEPRKNLLTLIDAIGILRDRGELRSQLLIAGATGWKSSKLYSRIREHGLTPQDVAFLGYVPEKDLPVLYAGARLFMLPSLYEGFGLPLVEAMACGVPVVASNVRVVSEVVEDAAILVSPRRADEFAEAILRLDREPGLRAIMTEKGLVRSRHFQWSEAARQMLQVFREASPRPR